MPGETLLWGYPYQTQTGFYGIQFRTAAYMTARISVTVLAANKV